MELKYLKKTATNYLGKEVKDAIIGIPAYFNQIQRQVIKDAANIAGLNCLRLISDTALVGNAYTFENYTKKEEIILVFDLGGGFLSVSIISLEQGLIEVKSVNGNHDIGGEDFLERLFNYCFLEFKKKLV